MKVITNLIFNVLIPTSALTIFCGCSQFASQDFVGTDQASFATPGGNGEIVAKPDTRTASVLNANRALDSLVSCLGTGQASNRAKQELKKYQGSLPTNGEANEVTAPMIAGLSAIAAEVCRDLVQSEKNQNSDERRIFSSIDFSKKGSELTVGDFSQVIRHLSRSCWGRNESHDERSIMISNLSQAFADVDDNASGTEKRMIYLCTAMASSFSSYSM